MNQVFDAECAEQFVRGRVSGSIHVHGRVVNPETFAGTIESIEYVDGELRLSIEGAGMRYQVLTNSTCSRGEDDSLVIDTPGAAPTTKRLVLNVP